MEDVGRVGVSVETEFNRYPYNPGQVCWTVATVKSSHLIDRSPAEIVVVVDKSGSMDGVMKLVKDALKHITQRLDKQDWMSIITYDTDVYVEAPLTRMDSTGKKQLSQIIDKISTGSRTNLCGGLLKGMDQLICSEKRTAHQALLLLTDGIVNEGVSKKEDIIEEMRKKQEDVIHKFEGWVFTFGYGGTYNIDLIDAISNQGAGYAFHIGNKREIDKYFDDCFNYLQSVVASNLKLRFEVCGPHLFQKVHSIWKTVWIEEGKCCEVLIANMKGEEELSVVIEVVLPELHAPKETPLFSTSISSTDTLSMTTTTKLTGVTIQRTSGPQDLQNAEVDVQKNRVIGAAALKKAADLGACEESKSAVLEALSVIAKSSTSAHPYSTKLTTDLTASLGELNKLTRKGRIYILAAAQTHDKQRQIGKDEKKTYMSPERSHSPDEK